MLSSRSCGKCLQPFIKRHMWVRARWERPSRRSQRPIHCSHRTGGGTLDYTGLDKNPRSYRLYEPPRQRDVARAASETGSRARTVARVAC
jgi:hypothetical protein